MRLGIAVISLAGCLSKPEPPGVPQCTGVAFPTNTAYFTGLDTGTAGDPTITSDLLEAFFSIQPDPGQFDIATATRTTALEPFVITGTLLFSSPTGPDFDAALTDDALTMVFVSDRGDGPRAYVATRSDRGAAWSMAAIVPGLEAVAVQALDLSPDGDTVYFLDQDSVMRIARRGGTGSYLVDAASYGDNFVWPTVSPDGRELFYPDPVVGIAVAVRDNPTDPFVITGPIGIDLSDPDITSDSQTLVMRQDMGISFVRRQCPAD